MSTDAPWVNTSFWIGEAVKLIILVLTALLAGLMVRDWHVRVNYTRKVNFFALFLVPPTVDWLIPCPRSDAIAIARVIGLILLLALFTKPFRERLPLVATMFLSFPFLSFPFLSFPFL